MNDQETISMLLARIEKHGPMLYNERNVSIKTCPGLRFVARQDGAGGSWVRRYSSAGRKMKQYKFAEYPATTLAQAIDYVERARGARGEPISGYEEPNIKQICEFYLKDHVEPNCTHKTWLQTRSLFNRNLQGIWYQRLNQVTANMLHEVISTTKERAPTIAARLRSELRGSWNYAAANGLTDILCPISSMTGGKMEKRSRDRVLNSNELPCLLKELGRYSEQVRDIIELTLYTGARSGELCSLQQREAELDQDGTLWLEIPSERMKMGVAHRIPLFSRAKEIVEKRIIRHGHIGHGYLFPSVRSVNKPVQQATLAREVYNIESSIDNWHLHDLRRTSRTNLQRIGCPTEIAETILAHKLPGLQAVYARYQYQNERKEWLQRLAGYYDEERERAATREGRVYLYRSAAVGTCPQ